MQLLHGQSIPRSALPTGALSAKMGTSSTNSNFNPTYSMYLPDTNLMTLQMISINKQCNTLNINSLVGGGYCAAGNPFNILTNNLFRCHTKAPDGFVVSLPDSTIRHVIHVIAFVPGLSRKSVSLDNKFQDRKKAW